MSVSKSKQSALAHPGLDLATIFALFEIGLAYGIVLSLDAFAQMVGFQPGDFVVLALLYPAKILLSIAYTKTPRLALLSYICIAALACVWPLGQHWHNPAWTTGGLIIGIPLMMLTIPTLTFLNDTMRPTRRPLRYLVWRSLVEIVVAFPFWAIVSGYLMLFMGGIIID